jgi:hypothetical protein
MNLFWCKYDVLREMGRDLKFRIVEEEEYESDIIWTDTTLH